MADPSSLAVQAVDAIHGVYGSHSGRRAVHSKGTLLQGTFTPTAQANARRAGREAEFDDALNGFCDEWNRGTPERARFEHEYLLAVGTRR